MQIIYNKNIYLISLLREGHVIFLLSLFWLGGYVIFSYHSFDCDFVIKCPVLKIDIVNCSHYREEEHYLESKERKKSCSYPHKGL